MKLNKILVPLDGSGLAEDVLVPVASLAKRFASQVTLLHVLEREPPASIHGQRHITDPPEGTAYLKQVAERLAQDGVDIETHVHPRGVDSVAAAIDAHAHEYGADLVAMCKHGGSTLRERFIGNIAQQILRGGAVPIFLRTPKGRGGGGFDPSPVLVPLDFDHDTEEVLASIADIVTAYAAKIVLFSVVPTPASARRDSVAARLRPSATRVGLEYEAEEVIAELRRRGAQLADQGIDVEVDLLEADPVEGIRRAARDHDAGLVVLSTHARAGFETWLDRSVGGRVIASAPENLLLLREL